jgi:peptidoglycan hydrolase CwlO-like protein
MAEIDISSDLAAVTEQIQKAIAELQDLDSKRQQLAQQIQNLNGIAMYLRGKENPDAANADVAFSAGDPPEED